MVVVILDEVVESVRMQIQELEVEKLVREKKSEEEKLVKEKELINLKVEADTLRTTALPQSAQIVVMQKEASDAQINQSKLRQEEAE